MSITWTCFLALATAGLTAYLLAPVSIKVAGRFGLYDHPVGYKAHGKPTPYLGGAAVVAAFGLSVAILAGQPERSVPLVGAALVLCLLGTMDDRRPVAPAIRLAVEAALGTALWALDLHWHLGLGAAFDLIVSVAWLVAVTNAINLFDNMDGAAGSVVGVTAGAIAVFGTARGNTWLAASAGALCGACAGFLPWNLSRPARLFLGDGGSMPLGFSLGALIMVGLSDATTTRQALAMGLLVVGVPALDSALVVISRRRRKISILTGGRDHLTHRSFERFRSARSVAAVLGATQAALAALAMVTLGESSMAVLVLVAIYVIVSVTVIAVLDGDHAAAGPVRPRAPATDSRGVEAGVLAATFVGFLVAISQFASGMYETWMWSSTGLVSLGLLAALLMIRRPRLGWPQQAVLVGMFGLAAWSIASAEWSPFPQSATTYGNRILAYAAVAALLMVLIRRRREARAALWGFLAGSTAVCLYLVGRMLAGDAQTLYVLGRLEDPVRYVNGQGAMLVLGAAGALALLLAERRRAAVAGAAVTTLCGGLTLLTQSRGAMFSLLVAALVVICVSRARAQTALRLGLVAVAILAASPVLAEVWQEGTPGVSAGLARRAAGALIVATGLAAAATAVFDARRSLASAAPIALVIALAAVAIVTRPGLTIPAIDGESRSPTFRVGEGNNRPHYWRTALDMFEQNPIIGSGAGAFTADWYRVRPFTENVRQPHSVVLQTLAETGTIGFVFLLSVFVALGAAGLRRIRHVRGKQGVTLAGLAMVIAWLVHASVDWTFLLPSVSAAGLLGGAILLVRTDEQLAERAKLRSSFVAVLTCAAVLLTSALSLSRVTLADHYERAAAKALAARDPQAAIRDADRALALDTRLVTVRWIRAAARQRLGDQAAAMADLRAALRSEPKNFTTWVLYGDALAGSGRRREAHAAYKRALQLNPRDPLILRLERANAYS